MTVVSKKKDATLVSCRILCLNLLFITVYINNEICSNQQCIGISQVLVTGLDVNDRNVVPFSK